MCVNISLVTTGGAVTGFLSVYNLQPEVASLISPHETIMRLSVLYNPLSLVVSAGHRKVYTSVLLKIT